MFESKYKSKPLIELVFVSEQLGLGFIKLTVLQDCMDAVFGLELIQYVVHVGFYGSQADMQGFGNALVGKAFGHQLQYIQLAVTERSSHWLFDRRIWVMDVSWVRGQE